MSGVRRGKRGESDRFCFCLTYPWNQPVCLGVANDGNSTQFAIFSCVSMGQYETVGWMCLSAKTNEPLYTLQAEAPGLRHSSGDRCRPTFQKTTRPHHAQHLGDIVTPPKYAQIVRAACLRNSRGDPQKKTSPLAPPNVFSCRTCSPSSGGEFFLPF